MVIGGEDIDQTGRRHGPGELLRSRARRLIVAVEASHVDLK